MPPFSALSSLAAAPTIDRIAASALRSHISTSGGPLRLTNLVTHWPARWNSPDLGSLRDDVGENTAVDAEVGRRGRGYLDEGWQRVTMGFGLFLDAFILSRIPSADPASLPVGYLAQAPLLDLPSLRAAVPPLEHYNGPKGDVYGRTLWVGPRGSFTPFHRDPNVGLYTHLVGSKVFHLLPPRAETLLRPSEVGIHRNTSTVPVSVRRVFGEAMPLQGRLGVHGKEVGGEVGDGEGLTEAEREDYRALLGEAIALDGACVARLGPGESVLIPEGWWHSAEGESVGVGVNAWFR